jgi:hypothetical protein
MRLLACILLVLAALLSRAQATPAPEPKRANPAILDAGREQNIAGLVEFVVAFARVAVREDEEVAGWDLIRRQKDWEAWLKKNLCVERIPETNHVRVSFRDGNATEQAIIVNLVVNYYLRIYVASRRDFTMDGIKQVKLILADLCRRGRITAEERAKREEAFLKREEEYLRTLPKLLEPAKER